MNAAEPGTQSAPSPEPSTTPVGPQLGPGSAWDPSNPHAPAEQKILQNLKKIYDPEIPMNIVDLGLIYELNWTTDGAITIKMTLTAPGCPVAGILADEVKSAAQAVDGVKEANVDLVWEPPWSPERMSEFAKRTFGYL